MGELSGNIPVADNLVLWFSATCSLLQLGSFFSFEKATFAATYFDKYFLWWLVTLLE